MADLGTFNNSDLKQIAELIDSGGGTDYTSQLNNLIANTNTSATNSRGVLGSELTVSFQENQSLAVCASWMQSQGAVPGVRVVSCNIFPSSETPGMYSAFISTVNS